jgi:hypothetical protein
MSELGGNFVLKEKEELTLEDSCPPLGLSGYDFLVFPCLLWPIKQGCGSIGSSHESLVFPMA